MTLSLINDARRMYTRAAKIYLRYFLGFSEAKNTWNTQENTSN